MAGTKAGGIKAAQTNKQRHGSDFYARIGGKGGANSSTGGFADKSPCSCDELPEGHYRAMCAGSKGGYISRRGKKTAEIEPTKKRIFGLF